MVIARESVRLVAATVQAAQDRPCGPSGPEGKEGLPCNRRRVLARFSRSQAVGARLRAAIPRLGLCAVRIS